MRVTAEARDHVPMSAGLVRGEFQHSTKRLWSLFDEFLREFDRSFLISEILGMSERQEKERFLPGSLKRRIVTDLDPFESKGESLRTLRQRLGGSAMDRARELIENDDNRQPRPRLCDQLSSSPRLA